MTTHAERVAARDNLRRYISPDSIVYLVCKNVARNGLARFYAVYVIQDNVPVCISMQVADVTNFYYNAFYRGVALRGNGYDYVEMLVSTLGYELYDDEKKVQGVEL